MVRVMGNGWLSWDLFWLLWRFLQLVFGIAVIGLYAQDLNRAHKEGKYTDGKWVFATVTSTLSSFTALAYLVLTLFGTHASTTLFFAWDWILTILWVAMMGIFGSLYIHAQPQMDAGIQRMKNAVDVDGVNLGLWGVSAIVMTYLFFTRGKGGARLDGVRFGRKGKKDEY